MLLKGHSRNEVNRRAAQTGVSRGWSPMLPKKFVQFVQIAAPTWVEAGILHMSLRPVDRVSPPADCQPSDQTLPQKLTT